MFYNATNGVVDSLDNIAHQYACKRETQRWPLVGVFHCLDLSTIVASVDGRSSLVSWGFKPSQPQSIISELEETFTKRYVVEMTNKKKKKK